MIKVKVNNEYKDVVKIFCGGTLQKEIIKVWSREAQEYVYESSVEYTGTLPITINANGDALLDYRIYGTDGGVGVATENLFDRNAQDIDKGFISKTRLNSDGTTQNQYNFNVSEYIAVQPETSYYFKKISTDANFGPAECFYDSEKNFISSYIPRFENSFVVTTPTNAAYVRVSYNIDNSEQIIIEGSTAPTSYIPYGYKLPMVVHSELKDIGDTVSVNGDLWDIVNYNNDFTRATLLRHELMPSMVYGAKQAIFAFPNGLAAGDYHFTIAQRSLVSTDVGKTLAFTLMQAIPEGGQLVLNGAYNVTLVGTTISSYASTTSTTAIETVTMTEGDSGTDLGSLTNAGTPASNINSLKRALLGSNEWKTSAQRQYLNSDKAAGSVWTPQTIYDRPPTWATNTAGFMNRLDEDFLSCVADTTYVTARNTVSDGGGTDTLTDKFYLPSRTEIFGDNEVANTPEGTLYQYYVNATNADRIKYHANTARSWRLRTPYASTAEYVRVAYASGILYYSTPSYLEFYAPACQIDLTKLSNSWLQNNMYKSVRATTTPVYIGENQLDSVEGVSDYVDKSSGKIVRRIKEYTFTGNENVSQYGTRVQRILLAPAPLSTANIISTRCSHFTALRNMTLGNFTNTSEYTCIISSDSARFCVNYIGDLKVYFKEQYDNGTPVKVWYVLETPVEEDPPVPLPEIPTIDGTTVIDYDGMPKPSQMYIKYRR